MPECRIYARDEDNRMFGDLLTWVPAVDAWTYRFSNTYEADLALTHFWFEPQKAVIRDIHGIGSSEFGIAIQHQFTLSIGGWHIDAVKKYSFPGQTRLVGFPKPDTLTAAIWIGRNGRRRTYRGGMIYDFDVEIRTAITSAENPTMAFTRMALVPPEQVEAGLVFSTMALSRLG